MARSSSIILPRIPTRGGVFNGSMDDFGRAVAAAVVQSYDFRGFRKIVDVGGGHGTLLAAILQAHPQITGILFDAPHVVASAAGLISPTGIASRCQIVGGDFFIRTSRGRRIHSALPLSGACDQEVNERTDVAPHKVHEEVSKKATRNHCEPRDVRVSLPRRADEKSEVRSSGDTVPTPASLDVEVDEGRPGRWNASAEAA